MAAAITLLPVLIFTGGSLPAIIINNPLYRFFVVVVFGYAMAPVIADITGSHIGTSLFFPNRANVAKPSMSHILSLRNKHLYKEATEELRMLNELFPKDIEPYKMLLHLSAHELPDRSLFDLTYRKGYRNLATDEQRLALKRYRDEHIEHKDSLEEEWAETSHVEEKPNDSKEFSANRNHHREAKKHDSEKSNDKVKVSDESKSNVQQREWAGIHQHTTVRPLEKNDERLLDLPSDEKNLGTPQSKRKQSERRTKTYRFVRSRSKTGTSIHEPNH